MQTFMVKKGLIDASMTADEIEEFLKDDAGPSTASQQAKQSRGKQGPKKHQDKATGKDVTNLSSTSEVTIYKRAVQQLAPQLEEQIDKFVSDSHREVEANQMLNIDSLLCKVLSSSDELMDISDETADLNMAFVVGAKEGKDRTLTQHADDMIRDAERSRARMYEIGGKNLDANRPLANNQNVSLIDNDYQMIDAHIDDATRKRIINFEFVDFGKLIKGRSSREEDNRLEFVTRNGMTYLTPVGDKDGTNINSYIKWEQAFHIYSNVLTSQFPEKSSELLQYNHMIHTASMSYLWENVYSYDKELRHHISHHPYRAWNVLLMQAWTMLLKDRLRHDTGPFQKQRHSKRDVEPCRCFNRGRCTYGLSCKFDHHCSMKKLTLLLHLKLMS